VIDGDSTDADKGLSKCLNDQYRKLVCENFINYQDYEEEKKLREFAKTAKSADDIRSYISKNIAKTTAGDAYFQCLTKVLGIC
jgi:hypothetical protein